MDQKVPKSVHKARLVKEGRWEQFRLRREEIRDSGIDSKDLFVTTLEEFPPIENGIVISEQQIATDDGRVSKDLFAGKTCSTQLSVNWVAKHIAVNDACAIDAPSAEAWGMLRWAQSSNHNEREFWTSIYPKLLPTRTQIDAEARFSDDGRTIITIIDRVRKAALLEQAGAKNNGVQPLRLDQSEDEDSM